MANFRNKPKEIKTTEVEAEREQVDREAERERHGKHDCASDQKWGRK